MTDDRPGVQTLLRLPRVREHRRRLPLLPALEIDTELRTMPIAPGGLHEHLAAMTVARLRNDCFGIKDGAMTALA